MSSEHVVVQWALYTMLCHLAEKDEPNTSTLSTQTTMVITAQGRHVLTF